MATREQNAKFKIEFLNNYFGDCEQDHNYAVRKTRKYNPGIPVPPRSTLYRWVKEYKHESPHIDDYDHCDVEVMAPAIAEQQRQLERDFLGMSIVQLKDYFRDSILKTIVHQNKANDMMRTVLDSLNVDIQRELHGMEADDKMKLLLVLGKAVKPFADANKVYLDMLEKLKIKRKDLETIENKKDNNKLDVNITVKHTTDETEDYGDHEDDQ